MAKRRRRRSRGFAGLAGSPSEHQSLARENMAKAEKTSKYAREALRDNNCSKGLYQMMAASAFVGAAKAEADWSKSLELQMAEHGLDRELSALQGVFLTRCFRR